MTRRTDKHDKAAAPKARVADVDQDELDDGREPDLDEDELDDGREPDDMDDDDTPAIQPAKPLIDRSERSRTRNK